MCIFVRYIYPRRMNIEIWPIDKVKPNPNNPRRISPDKLAKLTQSILDFPEMLNLRPIVVDSQGVALGGNMRRQAAIKAGLKEIPVVVADNLTEAKKKEFIVKDNVSFGDWEWAELKAEFSDIELSGWGVDLPDFGEEPEAPLKAEEDNYTPPDKNPTRIKEGDLIEIGPHRLVCGDLRNEGVLALLMEGNKADMVITDPPYNVDYGSKNKYLNESDEGNRIQDNIQNDKMPDSEFYDFLLDSFTALKNHTKLGGAFYVWHADSNGRIFRNAYEKSGVSCKQCLIWVKNNIVIGRQDYQWRHEPCLYGWVPGAAHYFTEDRTRQTIFEDKIDLRKLSKAELLELASTLLSDATPSTVIYCDKPPRSELHSTMKPVKLFGQLIENSSRKGDIVLDGFLGSGTTLVACHQLKRRGYGTEIDPSHCQSIVDRMRLLAPELTVNLNGKKI
jgi:DNA modification methylase